MNVTKKYDRFKTWAGERMGGEVKTSVSDNFKLMETEMKLRQEGDYNPGLIIQGPLLTQHRLGQDAEVYQCLHQGYLEKVRD